MLYGRLLDNNSHRCESLADLAYPVVLLQCCKRSGDRLVKSFSSDIYGVFDALNVLDRDRAGSQRHGYSLADSPFLLPQKGVHSGSHTRSS